MSKSSRRLIFTLLVAIILSLAGCGGCSEDKTEEAAESEAVEAGVDACAGLSSDAAAELLGVEADTLTRTASFSAGISCAFVDRSDPANALGFSVKVLASEAAAERLLDAMIGGLETISKIETVAGIGEAAYRAPDPAARRFLFRQGRVLVDVVEPADPELQRRVAAAIAGGF
jgi:hypothetical protein